MQSSKAGSTGTLIIIGGREEKRGNPAILGEVNKRVGPGKLVIATVASSEPDDTFSAYGEAFGDLGRRNLVQFYVNDRGEALKGAETILDDAAGVFFTGGDQLQIASRLGGTPVERRIHEIHRNGGLIAGTSAGAAIMSDIVLSGGPEPQSHPMKDLRFAAGFGLLPKAIVDQHFSERGRMGRLLWAVAQHPGVLGFGIDENTSMIVENDQFQVLGGGSVYIVDASGVTYRSIGDKRDARSTGIHGISLHLLGNGNRFDLATRKPMPSRTARQRKRLLPEGELLRSQLKTPGVG